MRPILLCILLVCGSAIPASAQQLKEITNSLGMKMVLIHAGSFTMGSPEDDEDRQDDETKHGVTISKSFYLGAYEVTQEQYEKVTGKTPSFNKGDQLPVDSVDWYEAVSYCKSLSELPDEKSAGREYRLPSESEWEYAYRAGSSSKFCFGDSEELLGEYAWFGKPGGQTQPVGKKKPNRWGLYDMNGNVLEWCQDVYAIYPSGETTDPLGPSEGAFRVARGGEWTIPPDYHRSARRFRITPKPESPSIGFRVAMSLPVKKPEASSAK